MENKKYIKIVNPIQAGAYVQNGVNPIKIYWSTNRWVWLFNKKETKTVWKKWINREIKIK